MELLVDNFEHRLNSLAVTAIEIRVLIAFLTEEGLSWLPESQMQHSRFIVGVNLGLTTTGALRRLQEAGADVRIFSDPGRMFHPKAVYVRSELQENLIVGSNNLTSAGVSSNHELAVLSKRQPETERLFEDFLAHFDSLLKHEYCRCLDDEFFRTYSTSNFRGQLHARMAREAHHPGLSHVHRDLMPDADGTGTLRDFLSHLSWEFPRVARRRGAVLKDHPLKRLNDERFLPRFEEIVTTISKGRLSAESRLNIGGNWYRIPNILATNESREPYVHTHGFGRLLLQIHYSEGFRTVHFSIVLHYYSETESSGGEMPEPVAQRYNRLLERLRTYCSRTEVDGPAFHHWTYQGDELWARPLIGFEYTVENLPPDDTLTDDLAILASALNGALTGV